jgi:hypothetical protein
LQRAFRRLHHCGPQPVAYFVAEMLDAIGADPASLDCVLTWCRLDPDLIALVSCCKSEAKASAATAAPTLCGRSGAAAAALEATQIK